MKKLPYLLALAALLVAVGAAGVSAQEVIYISDPTITDTPKMLPRTDASLWNVDFRCNPALLRLDCPYTFIYDNYYLGGYHKKSTGDSAVSLPNPNFTANSLSTAESRYLLNVAGGDAGFAMRLNDRANLAFLLDYRYGSVLGDGDFATAWVYDSVSVLYNGQINGSLEQRLDSHTVAPSVLFSYKVNDAFTVGASLKYAYNNERFREDIEGTGIGYYTEDLLIDRELCLSYHYLSPKVGISFTPTDRFVLNASVAAGFYFGGVNKDGNLFDDALSGTITPSLYTEDLHSSDVSGWDVAAKVRPQFKVSDAFSIPLVLDFWYKDFRWGVDGASSGYFAPESYGGVFQGPGTIDYENEATTWDITAGAGANYDAGWATLSGILAYTHRYFNNRYDQNNFVTDTTYGYDGLTLYSQDDTETRDILSLSLVIEKKFSKKFSADFGLRYDLGWGKRDYGFTYMSPYETPGAVVPLYVNTDGRDVYQNLTLSNHLTFTPAERLSISLGGFITIPLDSLDYEMTGSAAGSLDARPPVAAFSGPVVNDYENSGWEWGGMLSLTYEFGCPVVAPPVAPPVIEPKIEPMSMK